MDPSPEALSSASSCLVAADRFYASNASLYQADRLARKFDGVYYSEIPDPKRSESFKLLKRFRKSD
jgi:hypothetical protein